MLLLAAVCASLSAESTDCFPLQTASNALATGSQSALMNGVFGRGVPLAIWLPKPLMSPTAWTDASARASLFAGISLLARAWEISFGLLSNHLLTSTASAGFFPAAATLRVFTPTNGCAGWPEGVGSTAEPCLMH